MSNHIRYSEKSGRKIWKWALITVLISVFCIIFFAERGRFQPVVSSHAISAALAPFQTGVSWIGNRINYLTSNIWEIVTVHEQNKMLRNEVEQLRAQNLKANEYAAENERLRALWDYAQVTPQFEMRAARVIGREPATWTSMIVINKGTTSNVRENMAVVTEAGLVGHVTEAGPYSAKVQLLLDPRSSVGALVQRQESRVAGIVEGDITNPILPRMANIPRTADVAEGDVIVTSGFVGGIYPKGLIIGKVKSILNDKGGLLKYAVLEPAVNFQKLEDVAVIVDARETPSVPLEMPAQTPGTETPVPGAGSGGALR